MVTCTECDIARTCKGYVYRTLSGILIVRNLVYGSKHAVTQFHQIGDKNILNIVLSVCKLRSE